MKKMISLTKQYAWLGLGFENGGRGESVRETWVRCEDGFICEFVSLVMLLTCCSHTGRLPCLPFIFSIFFLIYFMLLFTYFLFTKTLSMDAVFTYYCVCVRVAFGGRDNRVCLREKCENCVVIFIRL